MRKLAKGTWLLVTAVGATLLDATVFQKLWNWYVVHGVHLPRIGYLDSLGVGLLVGWLVTHVTMKREPVSFGRAVFLQICLDYLRNRLVSPAVPVRLVEWEYEASRSQTPRAPTVTAWI